MNYEQLSNRWQALNEDYKKILLAIAAIEYVKSFTKFEENTLKIKEELKIKATQQLWQLAELTDAMASEIDNEKFKTIFNNR